MDEALTLERHEPFMELALEQAHRARHLGEVPIGALVVLDGRVLGSGYNATLTVNDPTAHAEVLALRAAADALGNYRLSGATLYCTVEPCLMCLGAAIQARVAGVVFGAADLKVGATGRLERMRVEGAGFNHRIDVMGGVMDEPAAELMQEFFRERRFRGTERYRSGRNGAASKAVCLRE